MTGDMGTAADVATGALIGRAVEPQAGDTPHHGGNGALCLNCGTRLIGAHCQACGQSAHVHRSLGGIGHEIAHGVFHFEGKIWRTLPLLILHPGMLTRRYVAGERARFVSPLALFLFTVFLMFATIGAVGGELSESFVKDGRTGQKADYAHTAAKARAAVKQIEAQRAEAVRAGANYAGVSVADLDQHAAALRTTIKALNAAETIKGGGNTGPLVDLGDFSTGWHRLDHGIAKANENPGLMLYKLQTSAYKYSWGLIPLSVPFMALLFMWRRKPHGSPHFSDDVGRE